MTTQTPAQLTGHATALIFFREKDDNVFPHKPEDARNMVYKLIEIFPGDNPITLHEEFEWQVDPSNLTDAVWDLMVNFQPQEKAGTIMSVHPKSMLLRIIRWAALARVSGIPGMPTLFNKYEKITCDLCESFNMPAVLTYEERASFSTQKIRTWGKLSTSPDSLDPETDLLTELCRRLIVR